MKNIFFCLVFIFSIPALWSQTRYYVNHSATGTNDGQSWQNAFTDLQSALQSAQAGDEVWVAKGTYLPTQDTDRYLSFEPASGVKLYGGFAGYESLLDQRDWESNTTILSGDIGIAGDSMDNSLNVVYLSEPDSHTVINGFWIRYGHANDVSSSVPLSRFRSGGGMYIMGQSSDAYPEIRNCVFDYNSSISFGAGVMVNGTNNGSVSPRFRECRFEKNRTLGSGGGIAQFGGSLVERGIEFQACTFVQNTASSYGGGMYYSEGPGVAHLEVLDCLFERNKGVKRGGGLYLILGRTGGAECTIKGSTFFQNISASGGAILSQSQGIGETKKFVLDSCFIQDNIFEYFASFITPFAAVYLDLIPNNDTKISIKNCDFSLNKDWELLLALANGFPGSTYVCKSNFIKNESNVILHLLGDSVLIEKSNIVKNSGQLNSILMGYNARFLEFKNSNFSKNKYNISYIQSGFIDRFTIVNSIFSDNDIPNVSTGDKPNSMKMTNSNLTNILRPHNFFDSNENTDISFCHLDSSVCNLPFSNNITCGPGNLFNLDPLFRDTANNDYSLLPCSPLLNAGSNAAAAGILTDIAGNPRIQEGTVDIGAYESAGFALAAAPMVAPACEGTSGGSISLQPVNGCEPYTYNWLPNAGTGAELNELPPGAYQLTLTDASGRQITDTILVPEAPRPDLNLLATDVNCGNPAGGSLTAVVNSGTGPFSYQWLPAAADTAVLKKLPAGAYALTLTDVNGCQDSTTANIQLIGAITLAVDGQPIPCYGQTGWLSATPANGAPPFSWQWSGWSGTDSLAQPLTPGNYA
ncbi:MAG: SprB repeat-containing protein, partial [Chitinophagales bacterium]|nr:SprB repeat-containing protein [Chitinophagales bacterium]